MGLLRRFRSWLRRRRAGTGTGDDVHRGEGSRRSRRARVRTDGPRDDAVLAEPGTGAEQPRPDRTGAEQPRCGRGADSREVERELPPAALPVDAEVDTDAVRGAAADEGAVPTDAAPVRVDAEVAEIPAPRPPPSAQEERLARLYSSLPARTADALRALARPAVRLTAVPPTAAADGSRLGGDPLLPDEVGWPAYDGEPLGFLAQVRLEEVAPFDPTGRLPARGLLCFFHGGAEEAWGFDPNDRGTWAVFHVDPARAQRRGAPNGAPVYGQRRLQASPVLTFPDQWSEPLAALLQGPDGAAVAAALSDIERAEPRVRHQLLGWPHEGRDAMVRTCRLASRGVYAGTGPVPADAADAAAADDDTARAAGEGEEWCLLLQLDSDDDAGMVWGDECRLYFWVPAEDLAATRFDRVWMVIRCG